MEVTSARRADIQGLRAVAVTLVIVGHIFPATIQGGFIGVDIFFVISGFVITQQMSQLHRDSPRTFLQDFYSRRIRRILPAAVLVTIVSVLAAAYFLGPVAGNEAKLDGGWVTIFLGNYHFHSQALDYFATGKQSSPLQHYWSLSIEEQFYLFWPALFLLFMSVIKSPTYRQRILGFILVVSLLTSLYQTQVLVQPIFFLTTTRIWELACGALLVLISKSFPIPRIVIYLCLVVFALSAIFIEPTMQWPRLITLPVIAATLLILMNNHRVAPIKVLQSQGIVYLGDLSYVLYLWHWPVLTIFKGYSTSFGLLEKLYTLVITLLLSVLTHHLLENPIRFSEKRKPVITISLGITVLATLSALLFTSYQG